MKLNCKKCWVNKIKKNWKRLGKQRYLCKSCWYVWEHRKWQNRKKQDCGKLFHDYVRDDLKYRQMCLTENVNMHTIQKWLDKYDLKKTIVIDINQKAQLF